MTSGDNSENLNAAGSGRVMLAPGVGAPRAAFAWSFSRSGGPGGQNVNKVNTKAELRISVAAIEGLDDAGRDRLRVLAGSRLTQEDEIVIQCDERRSQRANKRRALERLQDLVREAAVPPKVRRRRKPSRREIERRLERKQRQSEKKARRQWRDDS